MLFLIYRLSSDTRTLRINDALRSPHPFACHCSGHEKLLRKINRAGRSGRSGDFFFSTLTHLVFSPPTPPAGLFTLLLKLLLFPVLILTNSL